MSNSSAASDARNAFSVPDDTRSNRSSLRRRLRYLFPPGTAQQLLPRPDAEDRAHGEVRVNDGRAIQRIEPDGIKPSTVHAKIRQEPEPEPEGNGLEKKSKVVDRSIKPTRWSRDSQDEEKIGRPKEVVGRFHIVGDRL